MPAVKCSSEVIEIKKLTYDVKEISLKLIDPPRVDFVAGQYVSIEVTEIKEGHARLNNRPYSIASPPEESDVLKLCVNLVRGGPGSSYLHSLHLGDKVAFLYPMGYFTIHDEAATSLLFVATGTGIAPIKSMILHLLLAGSRRPMTFYWGLRKEEDLYYQDEFEALARQYPFFKYVITLSQPSSGWQGARGRVTHHLPEAVQSTENLEAYLCGNGEMIKEVRGLLIEKGMTRKSIHHEKFYN
jgi:CDP-4-dehydro-6-deoxyglucose reductase, E3